MQKGLADGLKTGHTEDGGYGLVASAERGGRRVIVVLNGMTSMHQRAEESERLLDWAFREFEDVTLFTAGDTVERVPVWLGTRADGAAGRRARPGGDDAAQLAQQGEGDGGVRRARSARRCMRGTTAGQADGERGRACRTCSMPLLAGADVPRLGLPGRAMAVLTHYVTGG